MKVILNADVKGAGKKGQLVEVAEGYGRNYLLPKGLASPASAHAVNELKNREKARAFHVAEAKSQAQQSAHDLDGKIIKISAKAGSSGRLFGSVTTKEIAEAVKAQTGFEVDRRKIALEHDIKQFGEYVLEIKLLQGIVTRLTVIVGE